MEEHTRKLTLVAAITVVAACVFVGTAVRAVFYAPEPEFQLQDTSFYMEESSVPLRLTIPSLSIDADVERVGINIKGNMAAPSSYADVGWYKYGTVPGEKGSAVIAGHLNNGLGLNGVFMNLDQIEVGDDIIVETKGGESLRFEVTKIATYAHTEVPTEELFTKDDTARLNLITCEGGWVQSEKTYEERLVVYSVLKESDQI